jgi:hypothetical protein
MGGLKMRGLKLTLTLIVLFFVAIIHINAANAAIIWDDYAFRYAVDANSADVYNVNIDRFAPQAVLEGSLPENSSLNSDPVNSRVDDAFLPSDPTGLGLQFNAGAGGEHLLNGVRIESYAETSTTSGGVLHPYAVGSPGIQTVRAFSNRNFHVDGNQAAILSGMAGGDINDPGFSSPPFLRADYDWAGGIWLNENVIIQGNPLLLDSQFIDFDYLRINGPQQLLVNLRTQDSSGNPISYTLRTLLELDSLLLNYDFMEENQAGDIPIGELGSLGNFDNPLWIEASMEQVPIPGSIILLLSGAAAIVGLRKRRC